MSDSLLAKRIEQLPFPSSSLTAFETLTSQPYLALRTHGQEKSRSSRKSSKQRWKLDTVLPLKSKTIHSNEPPWINPALKNLIRKRQRVVAQDKSQDFRLLRNLVNRERKICRAKYYETKVAHLKDSKPSGWWKEVKELCGMAPASGRQDDITKSLLYVDGSEMSPTWPTPLTTPSSANERLLTTPSRFPTRTGHSTAPPVCCLCPLCLHQIVSPEFHQGTRSRRRASLAPKGERRPTNVPHHGYPQLLPHGGPSTPIMKGGNRYSCPKEKAGKRW